jgi:hypothetical protein
MSDEQPPKIEERNTELEKRVAKLEEGKTGRRITNGMSAVALLVSAFAAFNSYQANQLKKENLSIDASHSANCDVRYEAYDANRSYLWLCWELEITNLSEDRTGIKHFRISQGEGVEPMESDQIEVVQEDPNQSSSVQSTAMEHPLKLDPRETKRIVVRLPVQVTPTVAKVMSSDVIQKMLMQRQLTMSALSNMFPVFDTCDLPGDESNGQFCTKHFRVFLTSIQGGAYDAVLPFVQRAP